MEEKKEWWIEDVEKRICELETKRDKLKKEFDSLYKKNEELMRELRRLEYEHSKTEDEILTAKCVKAHLEKYGPGFGEMMQDSLGRGPCDEHYNDSRYDINGDYVGA